MHASAKRKISDLNCSLLSSFHERSFHLKVPYLVNRSLLVELMYFYKAAKDPSIFALQGEYLRLSQECSYKSITDYVRNVLDRHRPSSLGKARPK